MHPAFRILPLCTLCLGVGLGLAWFGAESREAPASALSSPARPPSAAAAPASQDAPPPADLPSAPAAPALAPEAPADATDPAQEAVPLLSDEARTRLLAEMEEAYTTYDPAALPRLTPKLSHPSPEIRAAAREAIVQLGHVAGAAPLRAADRAARDPREATALLEAAEFLEIPPAAPVAASPLPPVARQTPARRSPPAL